MLGLGLTGNAGGNTLWPILGGVLLSFIGVALLTPLIARPVVALLGRLFSWSVPGKLGRLNSGRNPRRTAITAAALMVGIALITGVTVILDSAKQSLSRWPRTPVKADLIISGDSGGPRPPTFDPAVMDRPRRCPACSWPPASTGTWRRSTASGTWVAASSDLARCGRSSARSRPPVDIAPARADQMRRQTRTRPRARPGRSAPR